MPRTTAPVGPRDGMTLLEVVVVLMILGIAAAAVLPALRPTADRGNDESPAARARTIAVRRGEAVRLTVGQDGHWTVHGTTDTGHVALLSGQLSPSSDAPPSLLVSALGICLPEGPLPAGATSWDPARCTTSPR